MGEIEYEGEFYKDTEFISTGVTTGETGYMGKILFPGEGISGQNSIDDKIHIYINKNLSKVGSMETLGHELFGHGLIYSETGNRNASIHQFKGMKDCNTRLVNNIIRARKEIIQNQQ